MWMSGNVCVYTCVLCVSSFTHGHVCADFTKLYNVDVWECMCIYVLDTEHSSHLNKFVLTSLRGIMYRIKFIQCLIQSKWIIPRIDVVLFLHVYASNKTPTVSSTLMSTILHIHTHVTNTLIQKITKCIHRKRT
jgi:hypothetical protein